VRSMDSPVQPMHLSPTVAWTVVPVDGFLTVTDMPQYGLEFDREPIMPTGMAICISELESTFQPQAPRPPSQWVISPEQGAPEVQTLDCPDEAELVGAATAVVVGDDAEGLEAIGLVTTGSGLDIAGAVYAGA